MVISDSEEAPPTFCPRDGYKNESGRGQEREEADHLLRAGLAMTEEAE